MPTIYLIYRNHLIKTISASSVLLSIFLSFLQYQFLSEILKWRAHTTPDHNLFSLLNAKVFQNYFYGRVHFRIISVFCRLLYSTANYCTNNLCGSGLYNNVNKYNQIQQCKLYFEQSMINTRRFELCPLSGEFLYLYIDRCRNNLCGCVLYNNVDKYKQIQ